MVEHLRVVEHLRYMASNIRCVTFAFQTITFNCPKIWSFFFNYWFEDLFQEKFPSVQQVLQCSKIALPKVHCAYRVMIEKKFVTISLVLSIRKSLRSPNIDKKASVAICRRDDFKRFPILTGFMSIIQIIVKIGKSLSKMIMSLFFEELESWVFIS